VSRTTTGIGSSRLTKASAVNSSILGVARAPKGLWGRGGDVFWSSFVTSRSRIREQSFVQLLCRPAVELEHQCSTL
jgi:hypothetical protein